MADIVMGCKARDRLSGFEGTVSSRHTWADGSIQFGIQPRIMKDKPDAHPEAITFDVAQLEWIGSVDAGLTPAPYLEITKFKLGELVEDAATGYRGIAIKRTDFINGCVYFHVQGKALKKGEKPPKPEFLEHFRLKKVGPGIVKLMPKLGPITPKGPVRHGGPSQRVERI